MRLHFISRLALLTAGSFLVVASQEAMWAGTTLKWLFIAGGAVTIAIAAGDSILESVEQRGLDLLSAVLGAWMIVSVLVLSQADIKWWAFGTAVALAAVSAIGLVIHEWSTERVVHELRVTHRADQRERMTAGVA